MSARRFQLKLPATPEAEQTPLVRALLRLIEQQQEWIEHLEDEIRELKDGPRKPRLKPSALEDKGSRESGEEDEEQVDKRRRGKPQRSKTEQLTIHETKPVEASGVPAGSEFKGYRRYVVQDLKLEAHNTCFWLAQWRTPTGEYVNAEVPLAVAGGHFGPTLTGFVLYQYHHNHVTQPLLLEQLRELGVAISAGQLNRLLITPAATKGDDVATPSPVSRKPAANTGCPSGNTSRIGSVVPISSRPWPT